VTRGGFTLTQLIVVVAVLAVLAALSVPSLAASRRAENNRNAATSLKTLSSAEADFRANDRDWNGVNDFWTADVKSLYTLTSARQPIRLIEPGVAAADADGNQIHAGGLNLPLRNFASRDAHHGYWFVALVRDHYDGKDYMEDTGGVPPMGRVHNRSKFGFAALPDVSRSGTYTLWINENNSLWWTRHGSPLPKGSEVPATLGGESVPHLEWPSDEELKCNFCRF